MSRPKIWLVCACGFSGHVAFLREQPDCCPTCESDTFQQLPLPSRLSLPRTLPADWHKLNPEQKERVEKYIATLLAEQPRLL